MKKLSLILIVLGLLTQTASATDYCNSELPYSVSMVGDNLKITRVGGSRLCQAKQHGKQVCTSIDIATGEEETYLLWVIASNNWLLLFNADGENLSRFDKC